MNKELDVLGLTDKEKVAFLTARHDMIIKWLNKVIENGKKSIVPEPHPLDFSLSTREEEDAERYRVERINDRAGSQIDSAEYTIEAIENGTKTMIDRMYKEKFPCNEFEI